MSRISFDLTKIRAVVFDVDGVLSPSTIPIGDDGIPVRMANIKDGYALQLAVRAGLKIAIITGANTPNIVVRYRTLGINDVFLKAGEKLPVLNKWLADNNLSLSEIAYVGDDIPDIPCLKSAGLSVAPADAAADVKALATYISPADGGYGVARDLIEQILKAQGHWLSEDLAFGW